MLQCNSVFLRVKILLIFDTKIEQVTSFHLIFFNRRLGGRRISGFSGAPAFHCTLTSTYTK